MGRGSFLEELDWRWWGGVSFGRKGVPSINVVIISKVGKP